MKRTMRGGHRLALVSITAVLASLGSVPAFADEVPLVSVPTTTVDAATTTSTTIDEVNDAATATVDSVTGANGTVDQLSDATASVVDAVDTAAASTVDTVTDAAASTVDTVSNVASGTSGTITSAASDAGDSVAASAGNLTGAVTDGTGSGDAWSDTGSATAGSSDRTGGSSSLAGTSSDSTQGANPLASGRERTVLTLADEAEQPRWAVHTTALCPDADGPRCSPTSGTSEEDSLAQKISEVIGLLALTGLMLLPWIAAVIALTVLGSVALERARATGSRARGVSAA